jgi:hypothetical protein
MKILTLLLLGFLSACTTTPSTPAVPKEVITISEINPNKWTALTVQNLEQLIQVYDLSPILFTRKIQIEAKIKSHSHPILTLNTRFAEAPNKLLSAFAHEQLAWWVDFKKDEVAKAIQDLKGIVPALEGDSTYVDIIICFLEYESMIHILGKKEANKVLKDFIQKDNVYPWVNTQVYLKYKTIEATIRRYKLSPMARPTQKPTKNPPLSTASELKNLYRSLVLSFVISEPTPIQLT